MYKRQAEAIAETALQVGIPKEKIMQFESLQEVVAKAFVLAQKGDMVLPVSYTHLIATISIGQSIAVTPIQLVTAVSAVANGGTLLKMCIRDRICTMNMVIQFCRMQRK